MALPAARWAKQLITAVVYAVLTMPLTFLFSAAGYVKTAFGYVQDNDGLSQVFVACGVLSAITIVFLRIHSTLWRYSSWLTKFVVVVSSWLCITWTSLYFFSQFPTGAILLTQIAFPVAVYATRNFLRRHGVSEMEHNRLAIHALKWNAFALFVAWLVWLFNTPSPWNTEFQASYLGPLHCSAANVEEFSVRHDCAAVFIAWAFPVLLALSALTTALALRVILHTIERVSDSPDCQEEVARAFGSATRQALASMIVGFSVVILWMFAAHLSNFGFMADILAATFIMNALMLMIVLTSAKQSRHAAVRLIEAVPIVKNIPAVITSDTLRGALALVLMPFVLLHIIMHELVQNTCKGAFIDTDHPMNQQSSDEDGEAIDKSVEKTEVTGKNLDARGASDTASAITKSAEEHHTHLKVDVHWTNVLRKSILMGVFYMLFVLVFGRLVNVVLSSVNIALRSVSLALVCTAYLLLGTMMLVVGFPGGPVYVAGGLIVTSAGEVTCGFWGAFCLSSAVCMGVKICGVTIQQKVIGEHLGKYTSVRSAVGINTLTIRAIRHLLSQPGMTIEKVCILCGGPDWPTSVLTGILRLKLSEMLLGTLPVILLIAPCCLAGAVIIKAGDPTYQTLDVIAKMLGVVAQTAGLMAAMYFIEREVHNESTKLIEMYPDDMEVQALEKKAEEESKLEFDVTDWNANLLPKAAKICLMLASIVMSVTCYIMTLIPKHCFLPFAVSDTVDSKLRGEVWNLIRCDLTGDDHECRAATSNATTRDDTLCIPGRDCWGGIVMCLFFVSLLLYGVFIVFKNKLMAEAQKPTWRGITRKNSRTKMVI